MIMFELVFQIPEHHLRKLGIIQLSISIEVSLSKSIIMIIHPIPIALRLFFMETSPLLTAPLLLLNSAYCAHSPSLPGEKSNWAEAFIVVLQRLPDKIYGHRVYGWSPFCKPKTCRCNAPGICWPPKKLWSPCSLLASPLLFLNYCEGKHYSTSCLTPPRLSSSSVHPFSRNVVSLERTQVLSRPSLQLGTAQIFCLVIIVISLGLSADALSRLLSV